MWLVGLLACLAMGWHYPAVGWTIGSAVSAGILKSLEITIRRHFVPDSAGAKWALAKMSLLKLVATLIVLSAVVLVGGRSGAFVVAFCAGVLLTQSVIVLKAIGMLAARRLGA